MKTPLARSYPAALCALLLAGRIGLLRAEEPPPLNGLHLPNVQAYDAGAPVPEPASKAVVLPPVPLDRKNIIESIELDARGKPLRSSNPNRPFTDLRLSPAYQRWLYFFENGAAVPKDLGDEWTLVGEVSFETWEGSLDGKSCESLSGKAVCLKSYVHTDPDGVRLPLLPVGGDDIVPKSTLRFTDQTVSVGDFTCLILSDPGPSRPLNVYGYSKGSGSVSFYDLMSPVSLSWECRIFKNDESKLICKAYSAAGASSKSHRHYAGSWEGHAYFLVYSRDDGKDLLEPLPAILKPFAAPAPTPTTLTTPHPKD